LEKKQPNITAIMLQTIYYPVLQQPLFVDEADEELAFAPDTVTVFPCGNEPVLPDTPEPDLPPALSSLSPDCTAFRLISR
jgi:hypothetical protein